MKPLSLRFLINTRIFSLARSIGLSAKTQRYIDVNSLGDAVIRIERIDAKGNKTKYTIASSYRHLAKHTCTSIIQDIMRRHNPQYRHNYKFNDTGIIRARTYKGGVWTTVA